MRNNRGSVTIILICVIAILAIVVGVMLSTYNRLVTAEEKVERAYADIETQLQRRADLIPNLVNTVSGYMEHEQNIIESITASREKLLNSTNIQEIANANDELSSALSSLFVIVEDYPELTSNENFIALQDELAGTENRIATARRDYNAVVEEFNTLIRKFPTVLIASLCNMEKADYFEASVNASEVPNVSF